MFGGSKSSKTTKCKAQLKMLLSRIKLLRNKREIQVKLLRKNVAELLQKKQEGSARTRVEHAIREQNMLAAYDIMEGYCEFLTSRIQSLSGAKECPADLKEAIASLIYAGPRCGDLPELLEIRSIVSAKFGKQFIATIVELRVGCGVSGRLIEKLSTQPLTTEARLKFMAEAAKEYNVAWEPEGLSLSPGEVKKQQQQQQHQSPEAPPTAPTAKPRPSVATEPASLKSNNNNNNRNNNKSASEDFSSPKSPLSSVRSNGAGYDANSEPEEDSDVDEQVFKPPPPPPVAKPSTARPQQHQHQHIPFVAAPNRPANSAEHKSPYSQYNRGIVNPYVQKPATAATRPEAPYVHQTAARPEAPPVDPYGDYKRKFMVNSSPRSAYVDVASAAEAAAESADHAAAAARAAANLAHRHLSRESSMENTPRPVRRLSPKDLEERVSSYLQTYADDTDSSEWDSPLPREEAAHRLNPSRNLQAEQRREESVRRSTGSNVTTGSERVHNADPKRMSLGAARANQDEYNTLFQRRTSRATKQDENNGLFHREAFKAKQDEDNGLFQRGESRSWEEVVGKPVYDEEASKPSGNADVFSTSTRRPGYEQDYGVTRPSRKVHEDMLPPTFDNPPPPPPPTTAPTVGRVESFAVHLESMNENLLSRTEKLFEKEDLDPSPVNKERKTSATKFGGGVLQRRVEEKESSSDDEEVSLNMSPDTTNSGAPKFDTEVKLPSPKTETSEYDLGRLERTSLTGLSRPPARPPPPVMNAKTEGTHLDFNARFQGTGVDYTETSSLASGKKPYRFSGASVRTKRTY